MISALEQSIHPVSAKPMISPERPDVASITSELKSHAMELFQLRRRGLTSGNREKIKWLEQRIIELATVRIRALKIEAAGMYGESNALRRSLRLILRDLQYKYFVDCSSSKEFQQAVIEIETRASEVERRRT